MTNAQLDISRLAIDRSERSDAASRKWPWQRKWLSRYVIPSGILAGFAILILTAAGTSLLPKPSVQVTPVVVKRTAIQQSGQPLFQAAGWIEPRPTAINVPALAPGVVDKLFVVEGQAVNKGEPIAQLISIDAEIAVKQAQAALATADGELKRACAEQRAARIRLEKPVHLQVQLADSKSLLAKTETELAKLPFQIETAEANLQYAQKSVDGKRAAGKAVPGIVLQKAESELAAADATLRGLKKREPGLLREITALREKVAAIESQLELLVDETRLLGEADANVQSATALRDAAKLQLRKAELELARNTIRAPIDGRILRLIVSPGMRVMGLAPRASQDSSSVVVMYDPHRLQVRADVRLEDVPLVQPGQPVEIETASSEKAIRGRVLQPNSTANIQKNTLEVKVELIEPPDTVRPEMLVTATFLAPETAPSADPGPAQAQRIFVPRQLIRSGESGDVVWVVDANNRAREIAIVTGDEISGGELVEVASGLNVTHKLIASSVAGLRDGSKVNLAGEEQSFGR